MEIDDIIKSIYYFYPKNVSIYETAITENSEEYKRRKSVCRNAAQDRTQWNLLKQNLESQFISEFGCKIYDYSTLGNVPCYHASVGIGNQLYSFMISVIIPLWSYRIIDLKTEKIEYEFRNPYEKSVIDAITSSINNFFPAYSFLGPQQHQIVIDDIATAFSQGPTIFDAIFTENGN
ncbi:MAG: hypothetical protein JKY70_12370 [Mucilaginibacter sp.]|nr:hypothetical protein [Mucilaginibacter sp.]